jgi:hypothetical protein
MSWNNSLNDFAQYIGYANSLNQEADSEASNYIASIQNKAQQFNIANLQIASTVEAYKDSVKQMAIARSAAAGQSSIDSAGIILAAGPALKASYLKLQKVLTEPSVERLPEGIVPEEGLIVERAQGEARTTPFGPENEPEMLSEGVEDIGLRGAEQMTEMQSISQTPEVGATAETSIDEEMRRQAEPSESEPAQPAEPAPEGAEPAEDVIDEPATTAVEDTGASIGEAAITDTVFDSAVAVSDIAIASIPIVGEVAAIGMGVYEAGKSIYDWLEGKKNDPPPPQQVAPPPVQVAPLPQAQVTPTYQLGL